MTKPLAATIAKMASGIHQVARGALGFSGRPTFAIASRMAADNSVFAPGSVLRAIISTAKLSEPPGDRFERGLRLGVVGDADHERGFFIGGRDEGNHT